MARYRSIRVTVDHPLAKVNASVSRDGLTVAMWEHRVVLWDSIGPGSHPCHWCSRLVHWLPTEEQIPLCVDHVDGVVTNNDPANLVPSCKGCNVHRLRRVGDDELFVVKDGKRSRAEARTCAQCGDPFLVAKTVLRSKKPRAGTYCSRSCRAKAQWARRT